MIYESIKKLVQYGINSGLTPESERIYTTNLLLDLMKEDDYEDVPCDPDNIVLEDVLKDLLDEAVKRGIIEDSVTYRDLFDTKLMNCLVPRPAQIQERFWKEYENSPEAATAYYYKLSQDSDYIRRYRISRDRKWTVDTQYGTLDITINLSKPEKDPKAIAAAGAAKSSSYPKCQLCMENEGYAGRVNHPARENHRIIPITIQGKKWGFQYSPYVYYNEHCIVFNGEHIPMKIDRNAFAKLFDFIKLFPHYFLGSNADLPIVGGSILSHDHFQGGHYTFAMAKAPIIENFTVAGYEDIEAGIVKWPLSVIRLRGKDTERIIELADHILGKWRSYTDYLRRDRRNSAQYDHSDRTYERRFVRAGSDSQEQYYYRGAPARCISPACKPASHQERKHRPDRGYGSCCSSGPPERRNGTAERIHPGRERHPQQRTDRKTRGLGRRIPAVLYRYQRRQHHAHPGAGSRQSLLPGTRRCRRI